MQRCADDLVARELGHRLGLGHSYEEGEPATEEEAEALMAWNLRFVPVAPAVPGFERFRGFIRRASNAPHFAVLNTPPSPQGRDRALFQC